MKRFIKRVFEEVIDTITRLRVRPGPGEDPGSDYDGPDTDEYDENFTGKSGTGIISF